MSLVGFKAQNHTQQTRKRGPRPEVDDWATTPEVFGPLHERFRFTVDAAAQPHNAKLPRFWTPEQNGLAQSWAGERVWCNPPYSSIEPWVVKAHAEYAEYDKTWDWRAETNRGPSLIVMLLPANRTEQGWWQRHVEPQRRVGHLCVEFLPGRMRFIKAGATEVGPNERPRFGVCLLIWGAT